MFLFIIFWWSREIKQQQNQKTEFFLVRIFPHSDWIQRVRVVSPYARKYGLEKLRIWTLFTQCINDKLKNKNIAKKCMVFDCVWKNYASNDKVITRCSNSSFFSGFVSRDMLYYFHKKYSNVDKIQDSFYYKMCFGYYASVSHKMFEIFLCFSIVSVR